MLSLILPTPLPVVVGIDAGGTHLRVAVASADTGASWAQAKSAPAPNGGPETVSALLDNALGAAGVPASRVVAVCAGIAKYTRSDVQQRWGTELARYFAASAPQVSIVPDYVTAFHGALPSGAGIAALAGTGSVIYGENAGKSPVRVGGRGWEWGDEGSGGWLSSEAIRRTLRALDGMEEITTLNRAVCDFLQTTDPAALGELARETIIQKGRGFLVPSLLDLAKSGDKESTNLFIGASGWLAAQIKTAHKRLEFGDAPVRVALAGGLWEVGDLLQKPFAQVLARFLPQAEIVLAQDSPVTGAVRLARRLVVPVVPA